MPTTAASGSSTPSTTIVPPSTALELVGGHLQRERRLVGAGLRRLHPPADGGGGVDGPLVALAEPALLDAALEGGVLDHPRRAGGDGGRDRLPAEPARPHPR